MERDQENALLTPASVSFPLGNSANSGFLQGFQSFLRVERVCVCVRHGQTHTPTDRSDAAEEEQKSVSGKEMAVTSIVRVLPVGGTQMRKR